MRIIFMLIYLIVGGLADGSLAIYLDDTRLHGRIQSIICFIFAMLISILMMFAVYLKLIINLMILSALICALLLLQTKCKIAESKDD